MKTNRTLLVGIGMPCASLLLLILMLCLWEYRVFVGITVGLLISLIVGVLVRGMVIEQNISIFRFNHKEETPLTISNQPMVLRPDMRENPALVNVHQPQLYQDYQQQGR